MKTLLHTAFKLAMAGAIALTTLSAGAASAIAAPAVTPAVINADGSVDVWFGPTAPKGDENNWVQTVPGRGWSVLLRLYGPEKS